MPRTHLVQCRAKRAGIDRPRDLDTQAEMHRVDSCIKMEETFTAAEGPDKIRPLIRDGTQRVELRRHAVSPAHRAMPPASRAHPRAAAADAVCSPWRQKWR